MTAEKKDRKPLRIKNLADLKRHIRLGTELVATAHQYHPDIVGLTRVVTKVQTNGFYSQPDHKWSTCNQGMGFWSPFNKAGAYHFTDSTKYYICGNDWSIKELDSSEGYLVTPGNEQIGVDPKNYTAEYLRQRADRRRSQELYC